MLDFRQLPHRVWREGVFRMQATTYRCLLGANDESVILGTQRNKVMNLNFQTPPLSTLELYLPRTIY